MVAPFFGGHRKRDLAGEGQIFCAYLGHIGAPSKRVPVTAEMIKAMQRTSKRQLLAVADLQLPPKFYQKRVLLLNGSSDLTNVEGHFEGDLSGILAKNLPVWFHRFYKPGRKISDIRDWNTKLDEMVKNAKNWDVAGIAGVPAWAQLLLSRIIETYGLNSIHDIWPDFRIFVHGGVSMEPYRKSFPKLLGKEIVYLETYLASEGFLAYEPTAGKGSMKLVTDNGIFFEFIPFNDQNFTPDGHLVANPQTLLINEVTEGVDYALLISTCAGVWRYLIGDTIRFVSAKNADIVITGRTKHFLSLCGEHLSVDNMNKAVSLAADHFDISIPEFTVIGYAEDGFFTHKWFIGTDQPVDRLALQTFIDQAIKQLNDDYATERKAALRNVKFEILPVSTFYQFMKATGKMGAQNKFPRVIKGPMMEVWQTFVDANRQVNHRS